jgi:hypothetical protein
MFDIRDEHRLRVFESRVLRSIFGPKRDKIIGDWGTLHNEVLHNMFFSRNVIRMLKSRRISWAGFVARMGRRGMHIKFWWEREGKQLLGRPRRRWEYSIRMDVEEI